MSKLKLVIGNKNYSTWSLRPWFFLKQLGIEFEEEMVWLFEDDMEAKLEKYFSNSKVPVLVEDDSNHSTNIWDTLAIIEYAADKYPEKNGWPTDLKTRAKARSVAAEMHSSFTDLRNALPMNIRKHFPNHPITDGVQTDLNRIYALWDYCRENKVSNGPWLFGDFSGTDAMFAPAVMRLINYDIKLTGFAAEYVDFVHNSATMQEWIEGSKSETKIVGADEL
jgi:glutathione S-transferase